MNTSQIKDRLKQALNKLINEEKVAKGEKTNPHNVDAEYAEILNAFSGLGGPSQADVMQLSGLGKKGDKTAESLFSKKLYRKKNKETGGVYMFDNEERAAVTKAINTAKK
jgi:hypothetical protein